MTLGLVGASFGWDSASQCQTNCQMAKLIMFLESRVPRPSLVLHALLTHVLRVKYRQKYLLLIVIMRGTIALLSMLPAIHSKDYIVIRIEQT